MAKFVDERPDSVWRICRMVCFVSFAANLIGTGVATDCWTIPHFFCDITCMGPDGLYHAGTAGSDACVYHVDEVNNVVLVVVVCGKVYVVPSQNSVQCFYQCRSCTGIISVAG